MLHIKRVEEVISTRLLTRLGQNYYFFFFYKNYILQKKYRNQRIKLQEHSFPYEHLDISHEDLTLDTVKKLITILLELIIRLRRFDSWPDNGAHFLYAPN